MKSLSIYQQDGLMWPDIKFQVVAHLNLRWPFIFMSKHSATIMKNFSASQAFPCLIPGSLKHFPRVRQGAALASEQLTINASTTVVIRLIHDFSLPISDLVQSFCYCVANLSENFIYILNPTLASSTVLKSPLYVLPLHSN